MCTHRAQFRFYAELNDFLPPDRRGKAFFYPFWGRPSIKDAIEGLGVPHTEVDLILVNRVSVGFGYLLQDGDCVSVYPVFEGLDISPLVRLREKPLRRTMFVVDVHLGRLARYLRMLGIDALYRRDYEDDEIIALAAHERRIILTRDRGILKQGSVTHGYWVRSTDATEQVREVLRRFDLLDQVRPLTRCMRCNGILREVAKDEALARLPPKVSAWCDEFYRCSSCDQVYWKGSHYDRLREKIAHLLQSEDGQ